MHFAENDKEGCVWLGEVPKNPRRRALESTRAIVRLGPKRVATGLVASIAVRHWRMDWGTRGAALGCTRGWAIYGGRREGDSSIRATWEQAATLSEDWSVTDDRLSRKTVWLSMTTVWLSMETGRYIPKVVPAH